jgi:protein phosphatase
MNSHAGDTMKMSGTFPLPDLGHLEIPTQSILTDFAGMSHPGRVRANNEDHFLVVRFGRFLESIQTNLPEGSIPSRTEDTGYGVLVADGLGGRAAGEVASRLAISNLIELALATPDWIMRLDDDSFAEEVTRRAKERCANINAMLFEQGLSNPELEGMATTLTMVLSVGKDCFVVHVGDSRAYMWRYGRLYRLTRDHTAVQELADKKLISQAEVATHRFRNILTNALGAMAQSGQPEVHRLTLEPGDRLLICSDGLTDMVDDLQIARALAQEQTSNETCAFLIGQALEAGGRDNVTVVVGR